MSVTDRDLGYRRIIEDLKALSDAPHVLVGIRQAEGSKIAEGEEITLAGIAAVNEFGSADGKIPSRPFLRSTVDENRDKYVKVMETNAKLMLDGKSSMEKGLTLLGFRVVRDVQKKIRNNDFPRNAPATIKEKKSSKPLIDTGRLRQSIDFELGGFE